MTRVEVVSDRLNAALNPEDKFALVTFYETLNERLKGIGAQAESIGCDEVIITIDLRKRRELPSDAVTCSRCGREFSIEQVEKEYNERFSGLIEAGKPTYREKFKEKLCFDCAHTQTAFEEIEKLRFTDVILDELFPET